MFDYIKKQLQEQRNVVDDQPTFDDTETVLEYAHLFQELDDLTMSGTDNNENRFGEKGVSIEIPLEEDIEIESIEMNLGDGRVTDIPMDTTVQESNYLGMKTFEDFYQEAETTLVQFSRESSDAFRARKNAYASKKMSAYRDHIIQEGLFGFDKISLNDSRIPGYVTADFGPMNGNNGQRYFVKLPVLFEIDNKRRILKKQLDAVNYVQNNNIFTAFGRMLPEIMKESYPNQMEKVENIWDVMTPVKLLVPMNPHDEYKIFVGFDCDFLDEDIYFSWSRKIKGSTNRSISADKMDLKKINSDVATKMDVMSKKEAIKEAYELRRPSRFGNNYYQEAIEFGNNGDMSAPPAPEQNQVAPPTPDANMNTQPTIDSGMEDLNVDPTTVSADNAGATPTEGDKTTVPVDTNNVSDQIAEKVSDETNQNSDMDFSAAADIPLDGDDGSMDMGATDTNGVAEDPTANVDQQLADLDASGATDMELEPSEPIDVENMTIDELLAQGSEKLKGMTIQQLKDFLSTADADAIQEAFILTPRNINKEIDIHLRKALGILNDNEMKLDELVKAFKKEGKKLNRVLGKASKMKKAYSDQEREDISKLNKCLVDLMTTLKSSNDASYVATVKRLIQAFTSLSKVVAKIVEGKSGNKTVQEGEE